MYLRSQQIHHQYDTLPASHPLLSQQQAAQPHGHKNMPEKSLYPMLSRPPLRNVGAPHFIAPQPHCPASSRMPFSHTHAPPSTAPVF
mmetsp:Transcript_19789/g.56812  ORF Transcript_19789/g.56812 Transcript_19789/m.56812 type:complete len:87 (+) Transcript_19789:161-421(+)